VYDLGRERKVRRKKRKEEQKKNKFYSQDEQEQVTNLISQLSWELVGGLLHWMHGQAQRRSDKLNLTE